MPEGDDTAKPLRFTLTLSGGASLGAYQAGAAAGFALAVTHLRAEEDVETTVDAVGGASAGSLVSLCAAHCLLEGIDPVRLMHQAWVERVSLQLLRSSGRRAPLSFDTLREVVPSLLDPRDGEGRPVHRTGRRQEDPIALHVALTGLQGLTYPIKGLRRDRPIIGATYADWGRFELRPGGGLEQIVEPEGEAPLDFVLASSANPGAFAPRLLDRSKDEDGYRRRSIDSFPESGRIWYTDGGLLQSQPIGRVVSAAPRRKGDRGDDRKVTVLIDTRSEAPSGAAQWSDPALEPTWQKGLSRALAILPAQALYEDLRRIEKQNSRLGWADRLAEALVPHVTEGAREAIIDFLKAVDDERRQLRADEPAREDERSSLDEHRELGEVLRMAIEEVGGLAGKDQVAIDVISPLLLEDRLQEDVGGLLAGELLADFGGFLDRDLRASDFALGYESTLAWLPEGLRRCEVDDAAVDRTVAAVEERAIDRWEDVRRGRSELSDLPLSARLQLGRLALHTARVLASGAVDVRSKLSDPLGRALSAARGKLRPDSRA